MFLYELILRITGQRCALIIKKDDHTVYLIGMVARKLSYTTG